MADEDIGAPRAGPVRVVRLSVVPGPRPPGDAPLTIAAQLDPAPGREELLWWMEQLRQRVNVHAVTGSSDGVTTVQVEAPDDQFEAVARQLVAAVDEANAAYPDSYPAWRREQDARRAEARRVKERRFDDLQAVLDRVMEQYHSNQ